MTYWSNATPLQSFALFTFMFLLLCAQLFWLIKMWGHRKRKMYIAAVLCFAALFALFSVLYDTSLLNGASLPLLWGISALFAVFTAATVLSGALKTKKHITNASIKEAVDNLPLAVCCFNARGNIKLCNNLMYRLYHEIAGRDLQTLKELQSTVKTDTENGIYKSADGKIWRYSERQITADGAIYTETAFTDITEIFLANKETEKDNAELKAVNEKLKKMYARARDSVSEREYLAFKLKIHDEIGHSLAVIRKALQNGTDKETEKQIKALSLAAGTLVFSHSENSADPYDMLLNEAAALGVEIRLDGMLPVEPVIYDLAVKAIRECVTNCVRHAHGTAVFAEIRGIPGGYTVSVTNDGEKPETEIREGGGLSDLRRSIESAGGEMAVLSSPIFDLRLKFMREEMEL